MNNFKEILDEYMEKNNLSVYDIMDEIEEHVIELEIEVVENNDRIGHDSYGNEDSTLERIVFHIPTATYWKFSGTRQSYDGDEWNDVKQVFPKQIQKTIYEETNS